LSFPSSGFGGHNTALTLGVIRSQRNKIREVPTHVANATHRLGRAFLPALLATTAHARSHNTPFAPPGGRRHRSFSSVVSAATKSISSSRPPFVIATDPIGLRRPASKTDIEGYREAHQAPLRYVIYSPPFNHIAGASLQGQGRRPCGSHTAKAPPGGQGVTTLVVPYQVVTRAKRNITSRTHLEAQTTWARTTPTHSGVCGCRRRRSSSLF